MQKNYYNSDNIFQTIIINFASIFYILKTLYLKISKFKIRLSKILNKNSLKY